MSVCAVPHVVLFAEEPGAVWAKPTRGGPETGLVFRQSSAKRPVPLLRVRELWDGAESEERLKASCGRCS